MEDFVKGIAATAKTHAVQQLYRVQFGAMSSFGSYILAVAAPSDVGFIARELPLVSGSRAVIAACRSSGLSGSEAESKRMIPLSPDLASTAGWVTLLLVCVSLAVDDGAEVMPGETTPMGEPSSRVERVGSFGKLMRPDGMQNG